MLHLHFHPVSSYARRVRIALLEKNIPFEPVEVDMMNRAHKQPAHLRLNPYGRVPVLVDGDFVLFESTAILNYLEAIHPTPPLVPADAQGRALVDMHMKLCDIQFTRPAGQIVFPKKFLPKEKWDPALFEKMRAEIDKHFAILSEQLGTDQYLVRNTFSLADICYLPTLENLQLMDVTPPPNIAAWAERLHSRPSAKHTKAPG